MMQAEPYAEAARRLRNPCSLFSLRRTEPDMQSGRGGKMAALVCGDRSDGRQSLFGHAQATAPMPFAEQGVMIRFIMRFDTHAETERSAEPTARGCSHRPS